ncbi:MAG: ABC transporter permease [Muribaculaceae bacterium]|nr:ABC transporter permease [Muribaculaceae bacterium]
MSLILHNVKMAARNLMKYKLQTAISVLSIAVGIVTLSFTTSLLSKYQLPPLFDEPYAEQAYQVYFKPVSEQAKEKVNSDMRFFGTMMDNTYAKIDEDILRNIKGNGGLRNADKIAVPNLIIPSLQVEFHLSDSTVRAGMITGNLIDPEYTDYAGIRSAITGNKIGRLKKGEAIISEETSERIFGEKNPIGAVQTLTDMWQTMPVTITDVYESSSILDPQLNQSALYFCLSDSIEEYFPFQSTFASWIYIVLNEGSTKAELKKEIDTRIAPLGYESVLTIVSEYPQYKKVLPLRMLIHVGGALILLAAVIGFLRIEIQLFRIRRRELSLRITNGASRLQVFGCLFSEIAIVIVFAIVLALILGVFLQDFVVENLKLFSEYFKLYIGSLWHTSIYTGIVLLTLCSVISWVILKRISKTTNGIASNMRRSRSHFFRNAMLCIQIIICVVFVSSALILFKGGNVILMANNVPEKDAEFSKYLYLDLSNSSDANRLLNEISPLSDIDCMISFSATYTALSELADNPEILDKLNGESYYKFYNTTDTVMLNALGLDITWLRKDIDRNACFLLSEKTYSKFKELGILDKTTLTQKYSGITLPVGGIVRNMPYDGEGEFIVKIFTDKENSNDEYIIIPKPGRYNKLARDIENTIRKTDPQTINQIVYNFRDRQNMFPGMVEAVRSAGLILGIVSLIICAMSIYSTIALDTRARRKEVAIRRVNGAKSRDIYRLFGRVYIAMIVISLLVAVPLCVLFNQIVEKMIWYLAPESLHLSPAGPILLGSAIVIVLIFSIVVWQIHRVMQTDTAKIIAKE